MVAFIKVGKKVMIKGFAEKFQLRAIMPFWRVIVHSAYHSERFLTHRPSLSGWIQLTYLHEFCVPDDLTIRHSFLDFTALLRKITNKNRRLGACTQMVTLDSTFLSKLTTVFYRFLTFHWLSKNGEKSSDSNFTLSELLIRNIPNSLSGEMKLKKS